MKLFESRQGVLDQQRDYHAAHREEICAANKAHYETHREYFRAYYRRNKRKMLEYGREVS